ncbi:uncharacterized protein N7506_007386 [Penicillium brevicompactum]|uniref:uncharacterized protein n=1 Tax=Penicillium brevicompactum TaxID=5074 RepID=UPI0025426744|nr:uncharacterized protein N7506_007386 [Penicillium brevicompactum]KAJ5333603.1 hypothetical protein N7506_007386 [Penicillium brevicompactum]
MPRILNASVPGAIDENVLFLCRIYFFSNILSDFHQIAYDNGTTHRSEARAIKKLGAMAFEAEKAGTITRAPHSGQNVPVNKHYVRLLTAIECRLPTEPARPPRFDIVALEMKILQTAVEKKFSRLKQEIHAALDGN